MSELTREEANEAARMAEDIVDSLHCPHHDKPLVCGECGRGVTLNGGMGYASHFPRAAVLPYPTKGHAARPAHRTVTHVHAMESCMPDCPIPMTSDVGCLAGQGTA